jgi:predicted ABC-type sugar transport system permease subunit
VYLLPFGTTGFFATGFFAAGLAAALAAGFAAGFAAGLLFVAIVLPPFIFLTAIIPLFYAY